MKLTKLGESAVLSSAAKKQEHARDLVSGKTDIVKYVEFGVCYDVVVFTRFLIRPLDSRLTATMIRNTTAQKWRPIFDFEHGTQIKEIGAIPSGVAVGFYNIVLGEVFHAALSIGDAKVRSINGGLLGNAWLSPADLSKVLKRVDDGVFEYDRAKIKIFASTL